MKTHVFLFLVAVLMLTGCRTKHAVTHDVHSLALVDTTRTECDSVGVSSSVVDTTKAVTESSRVADVEFIEGGGSVTVDAQGNVTLSGVRSLRGSSSLSKAVENGIAANQQATSASHRQSNGLASEEQLESDSEVTAYTPPWYEGLIAHAAGGIAIIVLILSLVGLIKKRLRR